jgi:hypothetical protein
MSETDESIAEDSIRVTEGDVRESTYVCARCGQAVDDSVWHPVRAAPDEDRGVAIYLFCTPTCRNAWTRHRSDEFGR